MPHALGLLKLAADHTITSANTAFCALTGYGADEVVGRPIETLLSRSQTEILREQLSGLGDGSEGGFADAYEFTTRQGNPLRLWASVSTAGQGGDSPAGLVMHLSIPAQQAGADPRAVEQLLESSCAGVVVTSSESTILAANRGFTRVTGYPEYEVVGKNPRILHSGRQGREFYRRMWHSINRYGCWHGEIWNRHRSGRIYPERLFINSITDEQNRVQNYLGVFYDISAEVSRREALDWLANSDPLTGLPNRRWLTHQLSLALANRDIQQTGLAILFVDLDGFKAINDDHGHRTGDAVLRHTAQRLARCVRQEDEVARWGGDELVVAVRGVRTRETTTTIADKILDALAHPLEVDGHLFHLTVSIGIAIYPEHGQNADTLIERADAAMYRAKHGGKNRYVFAETPDDGSG